MNKKSVMLVVGGDLRQIYLAKKLSKTEKVYMLGVNADDACGSVIKIKAVEELSEKVDFLILPVPVTNDGVNVNTPLFDEKITLYSLVPTLKHDAVILGGKVSNESSIFTYKGFEVIDYFEREELSVLNAVPTSEGAIGIAMSEMPTTIYGQTVLITGYGRITKVLVKALHGLGAKVYVTARKYSDLAWAEIYGCKSIHISQLDKYLPCFDLVFNTVPSIIFTEKKLSKLSPECLIIDLASKPGGVDFNSARELGVKAIWALSLPGKVAPVTSGEITAGTILNILSERGEP